MRNPTVPGINDTGFDILGTSLRNPFTNPAASTKNCKAGKEVDVPIGLALAARTLLVP